MSKKQIEADKASREEVRRKACEKLGETLKRKMEEAPEVKPRKSRRYMVGIPLNFFVKKQSRTLQIGKKKNGAKKEKSVMLDYKSNFFLQSNSSNNIKCKYDATTEQSQNLLLQNSVNINLQSIC